MARRKHGRIQDELPAEIREQVDRLLIEGGVTYDDIKAFLEEKRASGGGDIRPTPPAKEGDA